LPTGPKQAAISVDVDSNQKVLEIARQLLDSEQYPDGKSFVDKIIQNELKKRGADLAVIIPEPISGTADGDGGLGVENIYVFRNSAHDKSNIAAETFGKVLLNWQKEIAFQVLAEKEVDVEMLDTFTPVYSDVADSEQKQAATWSKILPFIILIWSLTGAFYPAVDLCAGEKERGTFETLLSSPALRSEIAIAKLLTVMAFSMTTSILNLLSMGITGLFVVSRMSASMGGDPTAMPLLGLCGCVGCSFIRKK